jgi:hypothetical protein
MLTLATSILPVIVAPSLRSWRFDQDGFFAGFIFSNPSVFTFMPSFGPACVSTYIAQRLTSRLRSICSSSRAPHSQVAREASFVTGRIASARRAAANTTCGTQNHLLTPQMQQLPNAVRKKKIKNGLTYRTRTRRLDLHNNDGFACFFSELKLLKLLTLYIQRTSLRTNPWR